MKILKISQGDRNFHLCVLKYKNVKNVVIQQPHVWKNRLYQKKELSSGDVTDPDKT